MDRPAPTDHPIHELLARRWSPRVFADRDLDDRDLRSLLEAARWSPSCFNDQPWNVIVARRGDGEDFQRLLQLLAPANQEWAQGASALMLVVARTAFAHNGKPNRWAGYDCGAAMAMLSVEATARGLAVHQMGGFDADAARREYHLPDDTEPLAAIAVGWPVDADRVPPEMRERENAPRTRHSQDDWVHGGSWGRKLPSAQEQ